MPSGAQIAVLTERVDTAISLLNRSFGMIEGIASAQNKNSADFGVLSEKITNANTHLESVDEAVRDQWTKINSFSKEATERFNFVNKDATELKGIVNAHGWI